MDEYIELKCPDCGAILQRFSGLFWCSEEDLDPNSARLTKHFTVIELIERYSILLQQKETQNKSLQEQFEGAAKDSIYSPEFNARCFAEYVEVRKFPWTEEDTKELTKFMRHIQQGAFWEGQQEMQSDNARLREAVETSWAIDSEDGEFCQFCGGEIVKENEDDNVENILAGQAKYTCDHSKDCVVRSLVSDSGVNMTARGRE